ncbi:MAG: hypothetical protein PHN31_02300 [Candidatus Gracilibacteria bacterium]|nr:hypothetical protein [Candidatus Gracilibacteria bacterium]
MQEKIVETKFCNQCLINFDITDIDIEFLDKLSPIIAGQKFQIPIPKLCPNCRKTQRLAWRVETKLYKRKCDFSGNDIISWFKPDIPYTVYDEKIWDSDKWNPLDYGKDIDFSKTIFEQFYELLLKVPLPSKGTVGNENSDYCNSSSYLKNCYLTFSANYSEDIYYCVDIVKSSTCVDCIGVIESENCYECSATLKGYNLEHCYDTKNCSDSKFLLSCEGCSDCYGCFGLINSKYHIFNTQYSKEKYLEKYKEIISQTLSEQKIQFKNFYTGKYIKSILPNTGSENVYESENIINSENVSHCRHAYGAQNIRYCQRMQTPIINLAMDFTGFGNNAEKIYYSQQVGNNSLSVYFSSSCFNEISNIFYSMFCRNNVSNCFACIGIRNSSYCILNKQYTKEQYEELVPKIIEHMINSGEWGEFFPANFCPNGYNDSISQIIKPLTKQEAIALGFNWSDYEAPFPKVDKIIPANKLPEDIKEIPDDILNRAVECEITKKPFRIIKPELEFYRKHNLPIPKRHPDQRYKDRLEWYINY